MAIVVGTDTNQDLTTIDAYWAARNNTAWAALADADKEVYMRNAADWLERNFRWRGTKKTSSQRLGWPRNAAFDDDNFAIGETAAPLVVKEAEAIVADLYRQGTFDLEGIVTNSNAAVIKEKVDVIEVAYDANARLKGADVVTHVHQMLRLGGVTLGQFLLRA